MAKKAAKSKASPGKKLKASPPKQLKSIKKKQSKASYLWAASAVVVLVASIVLYQYKEENHTPPVGSVEIQHHEQVPVRAELLSHHPKVYMLRNVLSDSECNDIIHQAKEGYRIPSRTGSLNNTKTGNDEGREWRRSTTTWLRKDEQYASDAVKNLVSRIAAAANVSTASLQRGNPLHVTEYEPDGFYMPHTDSLHVEDLQTKVQRREYTNLDGFAIEGGYPHSARFFTALCYLSDDFEGGQTIFPLFDDNNDEPVAKKRIRAMQNSKSEQTVSNWEGLLPSICAGTSEDGMSIPPERGNCVLFYNHLVDENGLVGQLDGRSLHAGCTVRGGKKWIANVWAEAIPSDAVRQEAKKQASIDATGKSQ